MWFQQTLPPMMHHGIFSSISRMVTTEKNVRTPHHQSFKGNFHQTCDYFDISLENYLGLFILPLIIFATFCAITDTFFLIVLTFLV